MGAVSRELVVGRFEVDREVGRGGVGVVYRAVDTHTGLPVALKLIATPGVDEAERIRLQREGEILASLTHPGIVRVVAFGVTEREGHVAGRRLEAGVPYIAMEWLEGEDLQSRQRRAPLSLRQALDVARQIALALSAAHAAGVVHRDVKPSNVFVLEGEKSAPTSGVAPAGAAAGNEQDGRGPKGSAAPIAKLVDFGVAALGDVHATHGGDATPGDIVGTPAYMAPEQARGDSTVGPKSDLYSLGATLFELIAGRPPHVGPTSIATLARLVTTPAPRLSDLLLSVPEELDALLQRLLESEPERRPNTAEEVAGALAALLADPRVARAPRVVAKEIDSSGLAGTRLVTTLVALRLGAGDEQKRELERLREEGADALPLGSDALVAHLGARVARGGEAVRALELARQIASLGAHVGVATGRMRLDQPRSAGQVVDRAASLARDAGPGRLVADPTTVELARGRFEFEARDGGSAWVGAPAAPRQGALGLAPFVGREAEFAAALAAFERSVEDATPILVSISGPPGIGKSRLGREFAAAAPRAHEAARVAVVRCEPYGRAEALGVAIDAIRALIALPKGATLEQAAEALERRRIKDEEGGILSRLLANAPLPEGADPQGARDALYVAMTDLVLGAATAAPAALLVEDAQWSDPESITWIDHVLGRAAGRPVFVMLLVRPAFWRDQAQRFAGRDHVRIDLRPLARRAAREIARSLIGPRASDAMLDRVAQQAAGSPLFAEELARVIASGKDARAAPTIEAAIQVSLDALDDAGRDAVVRASVFGMSLWDAGLAELGVADPAAALRRLVAAELVVESAESRFVGVREYVFKHALVRDVAYASAGEELKKRLHAVAARWLAGTSEDAATVAQHLELGGQKEEAAAFWEKAARRALATNALQDAVQMADKALVSAPPGEIAFGRAALLDEAYERLDARSSEREEAIRAMAEHVHDEASELRMLSARARYDDARGAGEHIEELLTRVRARAQVIGAADEEARCSATLARRFAFAGELGAAEREAAHLLEISGRPGFEWAAVDAWQTLAIVRQTRGELGASLEARRSAAMAARGGGLKQREATLTMNLGFALSTVGARSEALAELEAGLAKALAIGSPGAVRHGQMLLLGWAATFGGDARVEGQLAETRSSADEAASSIWVVRDRATLGTLFYRGCELLRGDAGALGRARSLLKLAAEGYRTTENRDVLPVALGFWAEAERRFGHADHAVEIAKEAADLLERGAPSLLNEAPIFLALHDACVDVGDLRGARDAMARAIDPLLRRLKGLEGTPYARSFLTGLPHNAGLIAAAEAYGCVPEELGELLDTEAGLRRHPPV